MEGLWDYVGSVLEGNCDGKAIKCECYQPKGLCVEIDNVVYVADYRTSCVKVFHQWHTSEFLAAIGNLIREFSVHEKKLYELKSLEEAIVMVTKC